MAKIDADVNFENQNPDSQCPKCGKYTLKEFTISFPTPYQVYTCLHCGYKKKFRTGCMVAILIMFSTLVSITVFIGFCFTVYL